MCKQVSAEGEAKLGRGKKWKTYCCDPSNTETLQIKAAINKPATVTPVIYISAARHVPSAIVIFITENTVARRLLFARCEHQRYTH